MKTRHEHDAFVRELEELGEQGVLDTRARGTWGNDTRHDWRWGQVSEFLARKDREREDMRVAMEAKHGTGALRAAEKANEISERAVAEMASSSRWMKLTALFTGIAAIGVVIGVIRAFVVG